MLSKFQHTLPDMDLSINAKAEGRVLVHWEHCTYPNLTVQDSSVGVEAVLDSPFNPDWGNDGMTACLSIRRSIEEYFSDWIQPWVHFILLSLSYSEMYNNSIRSYFSRPALAALEVINSTHLHLPAQARRSVEGDRWLRRIATAGKQWNKTMGRTIDMEVYVYKLCLKWARLWSDDRESMASSVIPTN
ncbi:hypothetical protein FPV67DRAFT_1695304 [Lyophyllum atratum]|nr:hypothetical protein FPV67DRAFT_1695304 [Lyophyllum atratum]